ncbi:MAG: beta strand repeat-containing protein, partial [Nonlabens sp.]|uniref:beta strand repeat-containing protein n=1 Tax=Nonlabens sp. TaxID=1888209 RepID=UPI003EF682CC
MKNFTQRWSLSLFAMLIASITYGQFTVTNGMDSGTGSLRQAVADANATAGPNTITFVGNFTVGITGGAISISDDIVITGNGPTNTLIDRTSGNNRLFITTPGSSFLFTLNGVTVSNFNGGVGNITGGAINLVGGAAVFDNCVFSGNTVTNNTATGPTYGGGAIANTNADTTISNSEFINNDALGTSANGGALMTRGTSGLLTITNSTFTGNSAVRAGGAIEVQSSDLMTISGSTFTSNIVGASPGNGGAIHITGTANSNISTSTFTTNTAANEGGALWNGSGVMTITDTTIDANTASGNDTTTAGAAGGGGIYNEGGVVTTDATTMITNNVADGAQGTGGGVLNANGTFTATGSTISNNSSNRAGGGIEQNQASTTTLTNVTMSMNATGVVTGAGAPGNGGAIHVSQAGTVNITDGTYSQNTAANEGGALWNGSGAMNIMGAALIDNNTANGEPAMGAMNPGEAGGGGIYNEGGAVVITGTV